MNDHCPDNYLSDLGETADDIIDLREDRDNRFYNNYKDIIEYLNEREAHELFDAYRGSAALMLTLLCVVFVTFILILIACCGVCSHQDSTSKFWVAVAWILFIAFCGLFVAIIVYLGKS